MNRYLTLIAGVLFWVLYERYMPPPANWIDAVVAGSAFLSGFIWSSSVADKNK